MPLRPCLTVHLSKNLYEVDGRKYAVYVGSRVSLAHQAQIHGPAVILDDTFVGMKVLVFRAYVGKELRHRTRRAILMDGVRVPDGRYVPTRIGRPQTGGRGRLTSRPSPPTTL